MMKEIITYRGRYVSEEDVTVIRKIITAHTDGSRRFFSQEVCRVWDWRQTNGILKDMVCRTLLLLLESKGIIKQPPPKCTPPNPLANRLLEILLKFTPSLEPQLSSALVVINERNIRIRYK